MKYNFKAKNAEGEIREGSIDATSRNLAVDVLQKKGLILISIDEEKRSMQVIRDIEKAWNGVGQEEMTIFYRQLATLIEAKVSVVTALKAIEEKTENRFLGTVLMEIIENVEDGMPFSESLSKHRDIFSPLAVSMIRAGEVSGNLQKSILFVAESTEKTYLLNSRIKSALLYPSFVLTAAVIIAFIVFSFVIPKLTTIFKDMDVEIPWYTQVIIKSGNFMQSYWWLVIILVVGSIGATYAYLKTESGKEELDQAKLRVPVLKELFKYLYITRFSENMSILLSAGIPIVKSLVIVSDIVNNRVYSRMILRAAEDVKTGGSISSVFAKYPELPPILSKMIRVGEESGKISEVLKNVSDFYNQEIDRMTKNMTALIEPFLIVFLGVGVAVLVFAILMPIYDLTSKIN